MRYLDEFEPGQKFASDRLSVQAARIESFATEFDPQPFHLDEDRARDSFYQGVIKVRTTEDRPRVLE